MLRKPFTLWSVLVSLALTLAACGQAPTQAWPGLATNGQLAFVVQGPQVHAISLANGTEVWAFPSAPNNTTGLLFADPGVSENVLVVGSEGPASSHSGVLYGLDPATGQQQWCLAFDQKGAQRTNCPLADGSAVAGPLGIGPATDNRIIGGIALVDDVAYLGLASGAVYAVDALTGVDLWSFKAGRDVWAAPLVDRQTVYVTSLDHFVYALDRQNGALRWKKDMGAAMAGTPAIADGTLYIGTFGSRLYALDAATGDETWSAPANNWVWSGPALQDGVLYFSDVAGTVFAVDGKTGQTIWDVKPGALMRARPGLTEDTLYVGDREGVLFAVNREDGATRWQTATGKGQLLAAPVVTADLILVAPFGGDNLLAAYRADGGDSAWAFKPSN